MKWFQGWQTYALGSAFFAGLTAVLGKIGVEHVNSHLATFIRTAVILLMIGTVVSSQGAWAGWGEIPLRSALFLVLSAIATGFSWLCYYRALQLGPASRVAPVDKLSVVFAIALAAVLLGERMTPAVVLGGVLVTAGALVLALA